MKIAVYHNLHSGGAKRVVVEQVRRLSVAHAVTLFSLGGADHAFAEAGAQIPSRLYRFTPLPRAQSPFGRANPLVRLFDVYRMDRLASTVARDIFDSGCDVALVHPCQVTQSPMLLRRLRVPVVYYCHELPRRLYEPTVARSLSPRDRFRHALDRVDPLIRLQSGVFRRVDRRNARSATLIACNSEQTRADVAVAYGRVGVLCSLGVSQDFVDVSGLQRTRTVLSVGALSPHKGFDFVVEAVSTIPADKRPSLAIISNYQESAELIYLSNLATRRAVDVRFLCNITDDELRDWYGRAGCLAYAPLREPFGLVVLEAMAAGIPVVAVAEGGVRESVEPGVTGLLCPRDPVLFGAAVVRVLDDAELSHGLTRKARTTVLERRTWDHHITQLERLLVEAASSRKPEGHSHP